MPRLMASFSMRIATAYAVIDELTSQRGLVTCETISRLDEAGLRAQARR